jgi:hypothetical protein
MTTVAPLQPTAARDFAQELRSKATPYEIPRGRTTAELVYYKAPEDGSVPFNYVEKPPEGQPQSNFGKESHQVEIDDMRGQGSSFTLDNNAFEGLANVSSEEKDFADDEHIKKVYYPEVEQLLLENVPGATRVFLFDHTIRRNGPNQPRQPVLRVHIDQTPASAEDRVRLHMGDDAEELLKSRFRIINVWRPLNGPVADHPLAVADSRTVVDEDLVAVEHRYPHRTGQTAGVKYNPGQKWYYWSGMTNGERLLLKCYDSDETFSRTGRVPHTAFNHPRSPGNSPGRESIEVRALVFG